MQKTVVLVAGGAGMRMGSTLPKQFILLRGKPVFIHSIKAFLEAFSDMNIVLVLPQDYLDHAKKMLIEFGLPSEKIKVITGGNTRYESVKNGLQHVPDDHVVFVHDAVRCLVSVELIKRCYDGCLNNGSAIPVLPLRDSIREVISDGSSRAMDRSSIRIVQTPQTFMAISLKKAYDHSNSESFTDDATVFEAAGNQIFMVEGEQSNIKLTYAADIDFANWKLAKI